MKPYYQDDWLTVYHGDCRAVMAGMEPDSVHCVVTSPPYWGLRDYGTASWSGGDAECNHPMPPRQPRNDRPLGAFHGGSDSGNGSREPDTRQRCDKCGATRIDSQLGLEPTPEAYVANLVAVFREVRRVLRADGTVWLNLGDSYVSNPSGKSSGGFDNAFRTNERETLNKEHQGAMTKRPTGLKPKDLVGIPWRIAFALQADGWYLRSDIIWSKPNPMPESVTDRPTKSHEYLFLLSKKPRYYFDAEAVREPSNEPWNSAAGFSGNGKRASGTGYDRAAFNQFNGTGTHEDRDQSGRNIRSVWTIATAPYPGAHFATFPSKLVEPCIKAGTSERGVCPECGAPWERVVERGDSHYAQIKGNRKWQEMEAVAHERGEIQNVQTRTVNGTVPSLRAAQSITTGWRPSCSCVSGLRRRSLAAEAVEEGSVGGGLLLPDVSQDAVRGMAASGLSAGHSLDPIPATVLDPFAGSGTTGMVAQSLSRRAVLIDLSLDYLGQLMERNRQAPLGLRA